MLLSTERVSLRILVTGATGFIGHHLVRLLCDSGHTVRVLARSSSNLSRLPLEHIDVCHGDILDSETVLPLVGDVDIVIHLASLLKVPWKTEFQRVNVEGSRNIARACAAADHRPTLLFVSSLAAAGPARNGPRREGDTSSPVSIYGRAKLDAERAVLDYASEVPMSIVRPPMVFGEGDTGSAPLFQSIARGMHVVPVRRPMMVSAIHVTDLCHALMTVALKGARYTRDAQNDEGLYYASADEVLSYRALGETIAELMGMTSLKVIHLPSWVSYLGALGSELWARLFGRVHILTRDKWREATAGDWTCRSDRLLDLGWSPKCSLSVRLKQTIDWYADDAE